MYSTCLFCHARLGRNEAVEAFPTGKRLAFDAAKGRLWVVCRACERWNLTPLEERWEAIEACERLFRAQRLRAQTDNIGLARTRDGTDLVRVGRALRPELAAWRYGRIFGRRLRRRTTAVAATAAVTSGVVFLAGPPALAATLGLPLVLIAGVKAALYAVLLRNRVRPLRVPGPDGKPLRVVVAELDQTMLVGSEADPWALSLRHNYGRVELSGQRGRSALGVLLARINRAGARSRTVEEAGTFLAEAGSPERAAAWVAALAKDRRDDYQEVFDWYQRGGTISDFGTAFEFQRAGKLDLMKQPVNRGALHRLPSGMRLALEMSLHETTERLAVEGELAPLETAWREAEEVAAIADNLLIPPEVTRRLDELRG